MGTFKEAKTKKYSGPKIFLMFSIDTVLGKMQGLWNDKMVEFTFKNFQIEITLEVTGLEWECFNEISKLNYLNKTKEKKKKYLLSFHYNITCVVPKRTVGKVAPSLDHQTRMVRNTV